MKTLIKIGYSALLFEGTPAGLFEALAGAQLVTVEGYNEAEHYVPSKAHVEVKLVHDPSAPEPLLKALQEVQKQADERLTRAHVAENELKKLKAQYAGLE